MIKRFIKPLVFGVLLYILIASVFQILQPNKRNITSTGDSLYLVKPAFAQDTYSTFLEHEAGISAYIKVEAKIDLSKAKNMLRGIESEGDDYIIGIIELLELPEEQYPHMYICRDGWILAYYSKYAPTALIVEWYGYTGGRITTTTLKDALVKFCRDMGISYLTENIKYYHFKYPEATSLLLAIDIDDKSFIYSIPSTIICHEGSWSISGDGYLYIDGSRIGESDRSPYYVAVGFLQYQQLSPDVAHTVQGSYFYTKHTGYPYGVAVVFVYRG